MKQRIGIDIDGVLRNFSLDLYNVIGEHYPDYIKDGSKNVYSVEETPKEMTNWDLENSFNAPKEEIQRIYREEHAKTILKNGTPFKENVDYLREQIRKDEHTFIAVTSQHPICCHHTLSWLGKQELGFSSVVFKKGRRKWQVEVDYLVDDSPNNYNAWLQGRQMEDGFILMDRPWNQKIKSKYRVFNLKEAEGIIL
tara:strand:+ start:652 stop:1239 length:588 start_codon:yes stop_codon:yes gene_type:complete